MPFIDLDLVLRSLCANVLDRAAVRTLAVVRHLSSALDIPVDVACSLVAPLNTLGIGDDEDPADLFDRTFNGRLADIDRTVLLASDFLAPAYRGFRRLTCAGDVLAPANKEYRQRVVARWACPRPASAEIVQRFRQDYHALREQSPFDEDEFGLPALSLLHRVSRLAAAPRARAGRAVRRARRAERRPVDPRAQHLRPADRHSADGTGLLTGSWPPAPSRTGSG